MVAGRPDAEGRRAAQRPGDRRFDLHRGAGSGSTAATRAPPAGRRSRRCLEGSKEGGRGGVLVRDGGGARPCSGSCRAGPTWRSSRTATRASRQIAEAGARATTVARRAPRGERSAVGSSAPPKRTCCRVECAVEPAARDRRPGGDLRRATPRRDPSRGRQHVRHTALAAPPRAGRRPRRALRDQADRRSFRPAAGARRSPPTRASWRRCARYAGRNGATPGMLKCLLALRGARTLPLRLRQAQGSARELSARLRRQRRGVARRGYPGFGTDRQLRARATRGAATRACGATRIIRHATSLGGVETTMERRAAHPGQDTSPPG